MDVAAREILHSLKDLDSSKHEAYKTDNECLTVTPSGSGMGWFSDSRGSFLYEELEGDFVIETRVHVVHKNYRGTMPRAQFSSAGLLIRDPASKKGQEKWVMYNVGVQNRFYGREIKVTRPSCGFRPDLTYLMGLKSLSTLYLLPAKNDEITRLRLARVKGEIRAYHHLDGQWREEAPAPGMDCMGNGIKYKVEQFNECEFRPCQLDLPERLQVGIVANPGMNTRNPLIKFRDSVSEFYYYRSWSIRDFNDCLKA